MSSSGNQGIHKIIMLLQEMLETAEEDMKKDKKAYDKYICWVETAIHEKQQAVADGETAAREAREAHEAASGRYAYLAAQNTETTESIEDYAQTMEEAKAKREKEKTDYEAEVSDLQETIALLEKSIVDLEGISVIQKKPSMSLIQVQRLIDHKPPSNFKSLMKTDLFRVTRSIDQVQKQNSIQNFLPRKGTLLSQDARHSLTESSTHKLTIPGLESYQSQGGEALGMMRTMLDHSKRDLEKAHEKEKQAIEAYRRLYDASHAAQGEATKQEDEKKTALLEALTEKTQLEASSAKAQKALEADEAELQSLTMAKPEEVRAYSIRTNILQNEIQALGEALTIITTDEARDSFVNAGHYTFLQISSASSSCESQLAAKEHRQRRIDLIRHLMRAARKTNCAALATLAMHAKSDDFADVVTLMLSTKTQLEEKQESERQEKEKCDSDLTTAKDAVKAVSTEKEELGNTKIKLDGQISTWEKTKTTLTDEIAAIESSKAQSVEIRRDEAALYEQQVEDQRQTIELLEAAKARLARYYQSSDAPAEATDAIKERRVAGNEVIGKISDVVHDAQEELVKLQSDESAKVDQQAQFLQKQKESEEAKTSSLAQVNGQLEGAKAELSDTKEQITTNGESLEEKNTQLEAHHASCDFLIRNYDLRQTARAEEIESINQARAILAGAKVDDGNEE